MALSLIVGGSVHKWPTRRRIVMLRTLLRSGYSIDDMAASQHRGIRRIIRATAFSASGLRAAWANEAAFRQECVLAAGLIPIAFWISPSAVERALLIGSCLLVLIVELINSAIEATVDRIGMDQHALSGRAKDLGSAAVLMSLALTATVWLLIGLERLM